MVAVEELEVEADHGADFGAQTPAEYAQQANGFLNEEAGANVLETIRPNGDVVRFDPTTDEFGVAKSDGTIRTYFKPDPSIHGFPQVWIILMHNSSFLCPICGFFGLQEPAYDAQGCASFEICPSCGTEFGNHDAKRSHEELRSAWLATGAIWKSKVYTVPTGWNGLKQLKRSGLIN